MNTFIIKNTKYILAREAIKTYPNNFTGCKKNMQHIFKKFKLNKTDYIYVKGTKNIKQITGEPTKRDRLALKKEWLDNTIKTQIIKYEKAPDIVELDDTQKFKDDKKVYKVEIRGERNYNKCWFNANDIANIFGIKRVFNTLTNSTSSFEEGIDYKKFTCSSHNVGAEGNKQHITLFLTYTGLWRLMFVSRSKLARHFVDWASKTLFTVQFGTIEEKEVLAKEQLGVDVNTARKLLKCGSGKTSCIYLINIGRVKHVKTNKKFKNTLNLSAYKDTEKNKLYIIKYGRTDNLDRRLKEHSKKYGKQIHLIKYCYVDNKHTSEAEASVKHILEFSNKHIQSEHYNELVVFKERDIKLVDGIFFDIQKKYLTNEELITEKLRKITELESQIKLYEKMNTGLEADKKRLESKYDKLEQRYEKIENKFILN